MLIRSLVTAALLVTAAACGGSGESGVAGADDSDSAGAELSTFALDFRSPLRSANSVRPEELALSVTVDGSPIALSPDQNSAVYSSSFQVPQDRSVDIEVVWEWSGEPVARYNGSIGPASTQSTFLLESDLYTTTGEEFDADEDSFSNLAELNAGSNPLDPFNIDTAIPLISGFPPGVTGNAGQIWQSTENIDWRGSPLAIDNLIFDNEAAREDGDTEFFWQALYDERSLFIIVHGENIGSQTLIADSTDPGREDAVNILIDGDSDGVPNYHVIIPLIKLRVPDPAVTDIPTIDEFGDVNLDGQGNIEVLGSDGPYFTPMAPLEANKNTNADSDARIFAGPASAVLPEDILFHNSVGGGEQQFYEVRLRLEDFGITPGQPFGLDIQIYSDNNGGDRDATFAWKQNIDGIGLGRAVLR